MHCVRRKAADLLVVLRHAAQLCGRAVTEGRVTVSPATLCILTKDRLAVARVCASKLASCTPLTDRFDLAPT